MSDSVNFLFKEKIESLKRHKIGNIVRSRATEQMSLKKNTFVFLGGFEVSVLL